jgi:hypothetical protein
MGIQDLLTLDPGYGINIPDLQHFFIGTPYKRWLFTKGVYV